MASVIVSDIALSYRDTLKGAELERYDAKLGLIGHRDPYRFARSDWTVNVTLLPSTTYIDIMNYLVFSPSPYTMNDLQAYKGLDAYNQFVCGWVRDKQVCVKEGLCVMTAKVMHSQRLRAKPLIPWIISEKEGRILAAHCDCMAGLGETCTHIAALLFAIEATVKVRDAKTVTEEKAYWLLPGAVKGVTYSEVSDIDFTSAKTKKTLLDISLSSPQTPRIRQQSVKSVNIPEATPQDFLDFCSSLHATGKRAAILTAVPAFSDQYVPKSLGDNFPTLLTSLVDENCFDLNYAELVDHCQGLSVSVTEQQADAVEMATRDQADSKLWFSFRAGRITASNMKSVCHTDPNQPALSLVRRICNPKSTQFTTVATRWGCEHEKVARDKFLTEMSQMHDNFRVCDTGLYINPDVPHLGASPDGLVKCDCCGEGCLEIKCPLCQKNQILGDCTDPKFCLQKDDDGNSLLSHKHAYYYQVQTQIGVCRKEFGYFVVWTELDLHIELIVLDNAFWEEICAKSLHIFHTAILPELVARYFSKLPNRKSSSSSLCKTLKPGVTPNDSSDHNAVFCYCEQVESGDMVGCDNDMCDIKWFHFKCVKISRAPKTKKWYCPDCRKLPQFKRGRKTFAK